MEIEVRRERPVGLHDGAPLSVLPVDPVAALYVSMELVGPDLAACETRLAELLQSTVPAVSAIGAYLLDAGGKRLRPLMTALGGRAVGASGSVLVDLMCVGEMVHLGSLLHDDVVDDGRERRGRPTAQRAYGNPAVILAGDYCLARAVHVAATSGGHRAVTELGRATFEMAEGEVLQLLNAGNLHVDHDTYLAIIDRKSAALISWCVAASAWARGQDDVADALARYGREVGVAFQITDDVLDYTGEKRLTGKRRGKDLEEGKPTLPLILAMERQSELRERLAGGAPSPERIPALIDEVTACGAVADALEVAHGHVERGIAALDDVPPSPQRSALRGLARFLVDRVA